MIDTQQRLRTDGQSDRRCWPLRDNSALHLHLLLIPREVLLGSCLFGEGSSVTQGRERTTISCRQDWVLYGCTMALIGAGYPCPYLNEVFVARERREKAALLLRLGCCISHLLSTLTVLFCGPRRSCFEIHSVVKRLPCVPWDYKRPC